VHKPPGHPESKSALDVSPKHFSPPSELFPLDLPTLFVPNSDNPYLSLTDSSLFSRVLIKSPFRIPFSILPPIRPPRPVVISLHPLNPLHSQGPLPSFLPLETGEPTSNLPPFSNRFSCGRFLFWWAVWPLTLWDSFLEFNSPLEVSSFFCDFSFSGTPCWC